jgi:tetrachlorobenzoquinone reductase
MRIATRVLSRHTLAEGVLGLTLGGEALPAFEPGAHVDLHLGNGLVRSYSLTNDGTRPAHYELAVGLAADSRGGSAWVHQALTAGATIDISPPRNRFALDASMRPVLLVAGGIGVTPIMAMARACERRGRPWRLVYAARTRRHAAFLDELGGLCGAAAAGSTGGNDPSGGGDRLRLHLDDEQRGRPLDVAMLRPWAGPGTDLYCCGPAGLMTAVRQQLADAGARLHFEWFSAAPDDNADAAGAFDVVIASSGQRVSVSAGHSVLQALEAAGVVVPSVCQEGVCGTCECKVLSGRIDHRCQVLTDDERERQDTMMVCVSRAHGTELVLDL